jgi:adenylylsulfate kinase
VAPEEPQAFAVWITGLPASGKSTIRRALTEQLNALKIHVAVLESDQLRKILTPEPSYDDKERERFYSQMNYIGALLVQHGVPVIFDATANRRAWRNEARRNIANFLEVFVNSPIEVCMARDPKGIYRQGHDGQASSVPGLQAEYEPPLNPDLTVQGDNEAPESAARRVVAMLTERGWLRAAG